MEGEAAVAPAGALLPIDDPPQVEEVFDGAWKTERARRRVTVGLSRCLEKPQEEWVVEISYRNGESAESVAAGVVFAFEADGDDQPPFLHLGLVAVDHLVGWVAGDRSDG